jgi:hypothetical protein
MTPDSLFQLANPVALAGWAVLAVSPVAPKVADLIAGLVVPTLLSIAYAALILAFWSGAPGGFDSLPNVMALFTSPEIALAGWLHYLAFDLFVGIWIAEQADALGLSRWLQAPILAATFMFGPFGLVVFLLWRSTYGARTLLADGVKP